MNEKEVPEWTAEDPVGVASYSPHVVEQIQTLPQGVPHSFSEAIADIDEGEREFERGETYTHREVILCKGEYVAHRSLLGYANAPRQIKEKDIDNICTTTAY